MGGEGINDKQLGSTYDTINFQFGCQESETGLFRTQHVDGIMGMSASDDTLPFQLHSQKITKSKIFAMCFSIGGGILTLGGVNQLIHNKNENVKYAALVKSKGWFTVKLLDIFMRPSSSSRHHKLMKTENKISYESEGESYALSIESNIPDLNGRKGVIVDSGTTDTYLPSSIKASFEKLFKKLSDGITYSNNNIILNQHQYDSLPIIIYRLEGVDGKHVHIENHPSSYAESLGNGNYAFRLYLSEVSGAVLGANFMNNHNVIFDIENKRIGFVKSTCNYDHLKENISHNNSSYVDNSNNYDSKEYDKGNNRDEKSLHGFEGLLSSVASRFVGIFK